MKFQSLRATLTLANILPVLLLMPLLSLYLLYTVEEFYTEKLLQRLAQQALLLYDQVQAQPVLVEDAAAAQAFLQRVASNTDARVLLLAKDGTILGSSRAEDASRVGMRYLIPSIEQALRGAAAQGTGPGLTTEVVYVVLPVHRNGVANGVLRLTYEVADLRAQFNQLRWIVIGGTGMTAILGLGLGLGLATTITGPLQQLTQRAQEIAAGRYAARVAIQRQDEIGALARSFNQMAARLEEAETARQRQLAAIVHELARPLTGMRAAVETLVDGADDDTEVRSDLLVGIGEEIARLERLIKTLQRVQKQVLRPLQLKRAPVSLERLIAASVANFAPAANQLGIQLSVDLPAELPLVLADEDRIIQVLTNLLDNALKFTPHGGSVRVEAGERTDAVWVRVTDTGVGLAPEELPHLFQQFYRGAESRPPEKRGMGLGLTLSREIIVAHHGKIWAESEPGQGARFTFLLPKAEVLPAGTR
jgi:signal transduction histidine kinase